MAPRRRADPRCRDRRPAARRAVGPPVAAAITEADVDAVRRDLAAWDGDLVGWLEIGEAPTPFAHASEAEMSRILDFYAVRWEYEPHTFPILWNLDGDVVESFSPDFYLPDLDLYLEMTTLRQKLVRKKNRKLRRLRELYPDLNVKLFYARDFRALMLKYGKQALADGPVRLVRPGRGPVRRHGPADDRDRGRAAPAARRCPRPSPATAAGRAATAAAAAARRAPAAAPTTANGHVAHA